MRRCSATCSTGTRCCAASAASCSSWTKAPRPTTSICSASVCPTGAAVCRWPGVSGSRTSPLPTRLLLDRRRCRARAGRRAAAGGPRGGRGRRPRLCHPAVSRPAARLRLALGGAPDDHRQPSLVRSPRPRARLARRAARSTSASRGSAGRRAAACSRTPAGAGSTWWRCGRRGRRKRWW